MTDGPELVIGLVGAIGTDLAYVSESLERHLKAVGYASCEIRVTHLLHEIESEEPGRLALLDSITVDRAPTVNHVAFSSFIGFAPTRFADLFQMPRRVDDDKHILNWNAIRTTAKPRISGIPAAYLAEEKSVFETLDGLMTAKNLKFVKGTAHEQG